MQTWLTFLESITHNNALLLGLVGGLVITFSNALGSGLILLTGKQVSPRLLDTALGFAAGIMLAASFTSLILPGIDAGGLFPVMVGMVLGSVLLLLSDSFIPHEHFFQSGSGLVEGNKDMAKKIRRVWLFVIAITLHNMPEGLAVGIGFGAGELNEATALMVAIGLQNIPEGLAVSISSLSAGLGTRFSALYVGIRSGLVEIPLALFGAWAVSIASPLLPYAMGFAAGAMLYVISGEIIPETHQRGYEKHATAGVMLGILIMLFLDVSLGG